VRWIYLSPHLDDAVFSAGGLIFEQARAGTPVEIWTIMCGDPHLIEVSPYAQSLHIQWGFSSAEETVRRRREEDRTAAAIVGASTSHFDFLDCIYRRDRNGDWFYTDIFVPPHEADASYPTQIAGAISSRLQPDDRIVCPLALGSHVDHVLVRRAAELLGRPLRYITDIPYYLYNPGGFGSAADGMKETAHRITEPGLERWIEAALAYPSQLPALGERFDTPERAAESIRSYWSERQGIGMLQFG
jgi:LmbE family N-acetylglucosaminyl deacetylase